MDKSIIILKNNIPVLRMGRLECHQLSEHYSFLLDADWLLRQMKPSINAPVRLPVIINSNLHSIVFKINKKLYVYSVSFTFNPYCS